MCSDLVAWLLLAVALLAGCGNEPVVRPTFGDAALLPRGTPLPRESRARLRGVYRVEGGGGRFGSTVSVDARAASVSFFGSPGAVYAVMDGACLEGGERLVVEGSYRVATDTVTGLVRLFVEPPDAARALCEGRQPEGPLSLVGAWGEGSALPTTSLALRWERELAPIEGRFLVVAHRGGCRTLDECGASENSREVVRLSESFGANAIEVDLQLTADGVPVIYHDDSFSPRLVRGAWCTGPVRNFSLAHLRTLCVLRGGEQVPTLEELLDTVLRDTALELVWLDAKSPEVVLPSMLAARRALDAGRATGRTLEVLVGLPDDAVLEAYLAALREVDLPCLAEPSLDHARRARCRVWAPRWTLGPQSDLVQQAQSEGFRVIPWTLDEPDFIEVFLGATPRPDGILTNRPGLLFHHYQVGRGRPRGSP